jgi:hypothetical protein
LAAYNDSTEVAIQRFGYHLVNEVTMSLQGQAALVTGASRGIGKEIALELARRGYRVAVNYFNDPQPMVDATIAEIRAVASQVGGREVLPVQADIRSSAQVAAMFEKVIAAFGRLDLLVNNAGVQTFKPLLDVTEEEWDLYPAGRPLYERPRRRRDRKPRLGMQQASVSTPRRLHRQQRRN